MLRTTLVIGLTGAFGFAMLPSAPAHAVAFAHAPDGERNLERRGHAEVDASALGETGDATRDKVLERVDAVFTRGGVRTTDAASDPVLHVTLAPLSGDTVGYRISYQVTVDGEVVPGSSSFSDCRLCTEDELVDATEAALELTVEHMEVETQPEPAADDTATGGITGGEESGESGGGEVVQPRDKQPLEAKGKAGVALLAVGVVGIGAGIGMVVPPPRNQDRMPTRLFTLRPPGYAVLGIGAAAAITGAVLLALDRKEAKSGKTAKARRVVPGPMVGDSWGAGVVGRF